MNINPYSLQRAVSALIVLKHMMDKFDEEMLNAWGDELKRVYGDPLQRFLDEKKPEVVKKDPVRSRKVINGCEIIYLADRRAGQ